MLAISARRASEQNSPEHDAPPGSSPGILHRVIHQGVVDTNMDENGDDISVVGKCVHTVNMHIPLSDGVNMGAGLPSTTVLSDVDRALEPACTGRASSPPLPPLLPVPSFTAHNIPASDILFLTFLLVVCVTADLVDNITFVTHTHPDACVAAASTSTACGVGVPVAKFVAKRILGTLTSAVCPHAPAKRTDSKKPVGANGHIASTFREGQRAYIAAESHNATMRYAAYVLRLRIAFARLCKGLDPRWGSSRPMVLLADAVVDSGDDGVGVHGSVRGSRVFLA